MKKDGDSKKVDGVQYWWCPKHVLKGVFDGLYMPHKPGKEHDEWEAAKKKRQEEYKKKNESRKQNKNNVSGNGNQRRFNSRTIKSKKLRKNATIAKSLDARIGW